MLACDLFLSDSSVVQENSTEALQGNMNKPKGKVTCIKWGSNFDYKSERRQEISKHIGKVLKIQKKT